MPAHHIEDSLAIVLCRFPHGVATQVGSQLENKRLTDDPGFHDFPKTIGHFHEIAITAIF